MDPAKPGWKTSEGAPLLVIVAALVERATQAEDPRVQCAAIGALALCSFAQALYGRDRAALKARRMKLAARERARGDAPPPPAS